MKTDDRYITMGAGALIAGAGSLAGILVVDHGWSGPTPLLVLSALILGAGLGWFAGDRVIVGVLALVIASIFGAPFWAPPIAAVSAVGLLVYRRSA